MDIDQFRVDIDRLLASAYEAMDQAREQRERSQRLIAESHILLADIAERYAEFQRLLKRNEPGAR